MTDPVKALIETVTRQIAEERLKLATKMAEEGMTPDLFVMEDNLKAVIEDLRIPYECWPRPKKDVS